MAERYDAAGQATTRTAFRQRRRHPTHRRGLHPTHQDAIILDLDETTCDQNYGTYRENNEVATRLGMLLSTHGSTP